MPEFDSCQQRSSFDGRELPVDFSSEIGKPLVLVFLVSLIYYANSYHGKSIVDAGNLYAFSNYSRVVYIKTGQPEPQTLRIDPDIIVARTPRLSYYC